MPDGAPIAVDLALPAIPGAPVVFRGDRLELRDSVRFAMDSATILPDSHAILDDAVAVLRDYPQIRRLRIEGHTDEQGPAEYNLALSRSRAEAVRTYFVEHGIAADRLSAEGFGESRPVAAGHDAASFAKNRRTEFYVEQWRDQPAEEAR
ncbi:MAG: OmpA family protein [Myxococcota bacterium]